MKALIRKALLASALVFAASSPSWAQFVPVPSPASNTTPTAAGATIQGVAGGVPVPVSGTVVLGGGTASLGFANIKANTNTGSALISTPLISAATTNATNVKTSTASLYGIVYTNTTASTVRWLKLYNKASAPTPGTDVPVMIIGLPANSTTSVAVPMVGAMFAAGIGFAITANAASNDATAVAAGDIVIQLFYN